MSKILRDLFLKNKISFHNILEVQAIKKSNKLIPETNMYELFFKYKTEPFTEKGYNITCDMIYIPCDKNSFDVKNTILQYNAFELGDFVNDVKFLNDWKLNVKSIPNEMIIVETINYEIEFAKCKR